MLNLIKNLLLVALAICLWSASHCFAQERMEKLLTKEGQLISEGSNTVPVGELKATTYRLEIVQPTTRSEVENENPPQNRLFRLTIKTQEELPMETFSIWVDGEERYAAEQVGPKSVVLLTYAKSLENGLTLGLSVRGKKDLASRSVLPETLYVPPEYATPTDELETDPVIRLKRLSSGRIQIRVEFTRGGCFSLATALPRYSSLEIEGFERDRRGPSLFTCDGSHFVGYFSPEEFARIPNGGNIIKKIVMGNNVSRKIIGRLDKSRIE